MQLHKPTAVALVALAMSSIAPAQEKRCDAEPLACLKYIVENLEKKCWLGVELNAPAGESPEILKVIEGSPAEATGVQPGDFLVALNGVRYATAPEEAKAEAKKALMPDNRVTVTLRRGGREFDVEIVAGRLPQAILAQWIGEHMLYSHRHQIAEAGTE
jgi:C-terminal processing protease CtpA/Prc